jgi:hypothetical protein
MTEERSFENPAFANRVTRDLAFVIGAWAYVGLMSAFVTSGWDFWPRVLVHVAGAWAIYLGVSLLFWKLKGVPMGPWFRGRS